MLYFTATHTFKLTRYTYQVTAIMLRENIGRVKVTFESVGTTVFLDMSDGTGRGHGN